MQHRVRTAGLTLLSCFLAALAFSLDATPAEAGRNRPSLKVTSPIHGTFTTDGSVTVTGEVKNVNLATAVVTVNGTPVTLQPDGTFSHVMALNPSIVFNPIETRLVSPFKIDRRVVIAGPSVADGDFTFDALGLRLNDTGLDQLEPVVASLVDLVRRGLTERFGDLDRTIEAEAGFWVRAYLPPGGPVTPPPRSTPR